MGLFNLSPEKRGATIPLKGPLLTALKRYAPQHSTAGNGVLIAHYCSSIGKVNDTVVVKHGGLVKEKEPHIMEFVAQNTSVPVPRVFGTLTENGITVIVMEYITGK